MKALGLIQIFLFSFFQISDAHASCSDTVLQLNYQRPGFLLPYKLEVKPAEVKNIRALLQKLESKNSFHPFHDSIAERDKELSNPHHYLKLYLWLFQNTQSPVLKIDLLTGISIFLLTDTGRRIESYIKGTISDEKKSGPNPNSLFDLVQHFIPNIENHGSFDALKMKYAREIAVADLKSSSREINPRAAAKYFYFGDQGNHEDLLFLRRLLPLKSENYSQHLLQRTISKLSTKLKQPADFRFDDSPLRKDYLSFVGKPEEVLSLIRDKIGYLSADDMIDLAAFAARDHGDSETAVAIAAKYGHRTWPADAAKLIRDFVRQKMRQFVDTQQGKINPSDLKALENIGQGDDLEDLVAFQKVSTDPELVDSLDKAIKRLTARRDHVSGSCDEDGCY